MIGTTFACLVVLIVLLSPAILLALILSTISTIFGAIGAVSGIIISTIFWYAIKMIVNGEIDIVK